MNGLKTSAVLLTICLTISISGCASTKRKIVSLGVNIPRPHSTISMSCKKSKVPSDCADGLSRAIDESVEIVSLLEICEANLTSCTAHADTETWFLQSRLHDANEKVIAAKKLRWAWGAAGVATGAISVILGILFCCN